MRSFVKVMKALSDPRRVTILKMLQHRSMCVCEIQAALGVSQSTVSKHLKVLWEAGLVDPLCTLDDAKACLQAGPADSRDWARGQIIRRFREYVDAVDWSYISLRADNSRWSPRIRIDLPHLNSLNKASFETILAGAVDPISLHDQLIECPDAQLRENNPLDDPTNQLAVVPPASDNETH